MSKVLVDRELLERIERCYMDGMSIYGECEEIRAILAQPAEVEGSVEMGSDAWMALHLLDRLDVSADEEPRVQQVEEIVRRMGAALSAVTAERDRLESMLIRTTTRHFAQQWKDRADDKKLDECLSEGIAMLEAERDRLRAVLEGAQYPNIDRLKTLTIEQCRQVGETVMRLTIDAQSERDQLRAEVEMLREDAERWRYVSLQGDDMHWLNLLRVDLDDFGGNINAAVDALIDGEAPAMAAKEA